MNITVLPADFNPDLYNEKVFHPLQTWQWGEARKKMGITILRLGVFENDTLTGAFLMTLHPIPYTKRYIGYIPRSILPSKEVLKACMSIGKEYHCIFIKWEPDVFVTEETVAQLKGLRTKFPFIESSHPLFPKWTMRLDLTQSEEELMASFKEKTRYNIRLAGRKGVTVKTENDDNGFDTFIKLYFETCRRQHYFGHNEEYHRIVWDTLKGSIAQILTSRFEGEALGTYELFYFKNTLYYPYGGSSDKFRNVMAPNLLMWEAIRLGKQLGATSFDMWGSTHPGYDEKDPYYGFTRFKEGYNAKFVEMIGSYDLIINQSMYKAYSFANYLRKLYLTIRA